MFGFRTKRIQKNKYDVLFSICPNIYYGLQGPLSDLTKNFLQSEIKKLDAPKDDLNDAQQPITSILHNFLDDPEKIKKLVEIDTKFAHQANELGVNLETISFSHDLSEKNLRKTRIIISFMFIIFYFTLLFSMLVIESSDTINMRAGENSIRGEIQILIGIITASVGQILGFWFVGRDTVSSFKNTQNEETL